MLEYLIQRLTPKWIIRHTIQLLNYFVPYLTIEIRCHQHKFNTSSPRAQALFVVDKAQEWLKDRFEIRD